MEIYKTLNKIIKINIRSMCVYAHTIICTLYVYMYTQFYTFPFIYSYCYITPNNYNYFLLKYFVLL